MTTDKLTDDELLYSNHCYYCGTRIVMSYVGVVFDTDPDSPHPKPQILNIDGTQHSCAARQAVGRVNN